MNPAWAVSLFVTLVLCVAASAEGFAVRDLTKVAAPVMTIGGKTFATRAEHKRLALMCDDCEGFVAIDVVLGKSRDGTEGRFRSGQTTLQQLEDQCRSRDKACRLQRIDSGPATGWLSIYESGSTAILFLDGDTLTIRAIAGSPEESRKYIRTVLKAIAPSIVGR